MQIKARRLSTHAAGKCGRQAGLSHLDLLIHVTYAEVAIVCLASIANVIVKPTNASHRVAVHAADGTDPTHPRIASSSL
jgi:hypothetical protein